MNYLGKIGIVSFLKNVYGHSVHSDLLDFNEYSFKEISLLKKIPKEPFFSLEKVVYPFDDEPRIFFYQNSPSLSKYKYLKTSGKSFSSEKSALFAAIGETIERFNWYNFTPKIFSTKSTSSIKSKKVDVMSLPGFSKETKRKDKRLQYDIHSIFQWTEIVDLVSKEKILCPTQLVSPVFFRETVIKEKKEAILRMPVSTGVVAGNSKEEVIYKGILESIERDAFMITYLNRLSPPRIDLESSELKINNIQINSYFNKFNLKPISVVLISDITPYSVMSFLIDESGNGPALSTGAATDFDIESAVIKSLEEAMSVRLSSKVHQLHREKIKDNFSNFTQKDRKIFWSKIKNLDRISFMLEGEYKKIHEFHNIEVGTKNGKNIQKRIDYLLSIFRGKNYQCLYIDTTSKDVDLNIKTGIVLIPQLQPMHLDEEFPYFGGDRLNSIHANYNNDSHDKDLAPHPFH